MNNNYLERVDKKFSDIEALEEVSRCLLCEDAPCSKGCPASTNPAKFIRSMRFKNLKGAVETIRENNPLGSICARVCPTERYCEQACSRCGIDKSIQIAKIQEYLTDFENRVGMKVQKQGESNGKKVAIIGSGPAGLSCASFLAQMGYDVTIFEMREHEGGWLTYGIPEFHVDQKTVNKDIDYIKGLGVKIQTGKTFGKDVCLQCLKEDGYQAVLMSTGFSYGKVIDLFKDNNYSEKAVEFLAKAKTSHGNLDVPKDVLVIGGGDAAMDSGMTAKKLGAINVKIVTRKPWRTFRASKSQVASTRKLDISIIDGFAPVSVDENKVTFKSQVDDSTLEIKADKIILAFGQKGNIEKLLPEIKTNNGNVVTDNYRTNIDGVFAAGDIIEGSDRTVVSAVRDGKKVAKAIDEYLTGGTK